MLDHGQSRCHAVETDVDLTHFVGRCGLVQLAGCVITGADPAGGQPELAQRPVDQPRQQGSAGQRQAQGQQHPGNPAQVVGAHQVLGRDAQPPGLAVQRKADPQAIDAIDAAGNDDTGGTALTQVFDQVLVQRIAPGRGHHIGWLARLGLQAFVPGQGLQQAWARSRLHVVQYRAQHMDQGGDLVCGQAGLRFVFQRAYRAVPGRQAAGQQQCQQQKGAPEQADAGLGCPQPAQQRTGPALQSAGLRRRRGRLMCFHRVRTRNPRPIRFAGSAAWPDRLRSAGAAATPARPGSGRTA